MCPDDVYGQQEIHINGDVALAFQNYLYLTEVLVHGPGAVTACGLRFTELCLAGSVRLQGGPRRRAGLRCGELLGVPGEMEPRRAQVSPLG